MIKQILLKDLGPIKEADLEINDLTIICGKNSVGKTYLSYSYYMLSKLASGLLRSEYVFPSSFTDAIKNIDFTSNAKHVFELDVRDINYNFDLIERTLKSKKVVETICRELTVTPKESTEINVQLERNITEGFSDFKYDLNFGGIFKMRIFSHKDSYTINFEINLIEVEYDQSNLEEIIGDIRLLFGVVFFGRHLKFEQYAITSERTGISLFYSDYEETKRANMLSLFDDHETSFTENSHHLSRKSYSEPIEDNISIIRRIKKNAPVPWGFPEHDNVYGILSQLKGGDYKVSNGRIYFQPHDTDDMVPLHASSGASKSLLLIDDFVNDYEVSRYGTLIIDEPELNLHLDAQKKMAQLLCALVKDGIKVLVTTHSDHFIREVNNLIMLSNENISLSAKVDIMERGNIKEISLIDRNKVSTTIIDSATRATIPMEVTEYGIDLTIFNEEIVSSNDITNELFMEIYNPR